MAELADSARELAEKLVLAGVGAVALTAERADALAEELSARGGMGREEARSLVEELELRVAQLEHRLRLVEPDQTRA